MNEAMTNLRLAYFMRNIVMFTTGLCLPSIVGALKPMRLRCVGDVTRKGKEMCTECVETS
jgi:hypothetical protein